MLSSAHTWRFSKTNSPIIIFFSPEIGIIRFANDQDFTSASYQERIVVIKKFKKKIIEKLIVLITISQGIVYDGLSFES